MNDSSPQQLHAIFIFSLKQAPLPRYFVTHLNLVSGVE